MTDSDRRNEIYRRLSDANAELWQGIRGTPALTAELKQLRDGDDCKHEGRHSQVRYRVTGGAFQARKCCEICGDVFGSAVAPIGKPPAWDAGRLVLWVERRITELRAVFDKHRKLQAIELAGMRADHAAYLQSPEWRERRRKVLERAGGLCEGCRSNRATQVHHLTYKHWGRELLFELVALCDACHGICHEDRKESA